MWRRRRTAEPARPKPRIIMAQVAGSGTAPVSCENGMSCENRSPILLSWVPLFVQRIFRCGPVDAKLKAPLLAVRSNVRLLAFAATFGAKLKQTKPAPLPLQPPALRPPEIALTLAPPPPTWVAVIALAPRPLNEKAPRNCAPDQLPESVLAPAISKVTFVLLFWVRVKVAPWKVV